VSLGQKIRNRRLEKGLLPKDVAELIGVTEDCLTLWENKHSKPLVAFYLKIIDFLDYFPFDIDTSALRGRITYYRYMHGLTPKEFGLLVNAHPSVLAWEKGESLPQRGRVLLVKAITAEVPSPFNYKNR